MYVSASGATTRMLRPAVSGAGSCGRSCAETTTNETAASPPRIRKKCNVTPKTIANLRRGAAEKGGRFYLARKGPSPASAAT